MLAMSFTQISFAASIYSDDLVVTATRTATSVDSLVSDVSLVSRQEIQISAASSVIDLLKMQQGVEIETNGGLGQVSALHLRGNSSQSAIILVDGIRVGSATTGLTALERIPLEQVEKIEIVRGAVSSIYGADGIGGVVQIFTKQSNNKPTLSFYTGYGSYNTRESSVRFADKTGSSKYSFNLSSTDSDGISALRYKDKYQYNTGDKDPYRNLTFSGMLSHEIIPGHEIGVNYFNSNNNLGFDDDSVSPAKARSALGSFNIYSLNRITPYWTSKLSLGQGTDIFRSNGSVSLSSATHNYQRQYAWQNDFSLPLGNLTLGIDRLEQNVDGKIQSYDGDYNLVTANYQKKSRDNNAYFAVYHLNENQHTLQFSMRKDLNSQFGSYTTGNLGYGYQITPTLRVFGSVARAFRAPTFNDLYWPYQDYGYGYSFSGNPRITPETSRNKELSMVYDQGHHRISATLFHNHVNNLILPAQGLDADFPINVGSALIKGVSASYEGWVDQFGFKANMDIQSPRNEDTGLLLTRRAQRHGSLKISYTQNDLSLITELYGTSERFNDAANEVRLSGYALLNLIASYKLNPEWSMQMKANNVLDKKYETTAFFDFNSYNTPGANVFFSLRYTPEINTPK